MGQEWDYPQSGGWRREILASSQQFGPIIEHDPPKRWTISRSYIREMRGPEPWPYKAALTGLFLTFWLLYAAIIFIATLVICMMIWPPAAHAASFPIGQTEAKLNAKAKELGYKVKFRSHNCSMAAQYVCDISAFTSGSQIRFMAVSDDKAADVSHFSFPIGQANMMNTTLLVIAASEVTSLFSSENYQIDEYTSFMTDLFNQAKDAGAMATNDLGETQQSASIIPQVGSILMIRDATYKPKSDQANSAQ